MRDTTTHPETPPLNAHPTEDRGFACLVSHSLIRDKVAKGNTQYSHNLFANPADIVSRGASC